MPLRIGIDEAGYGPLLGPLVAAASVWRVPPALAEADLWDVLSAGVRRTPRGADDRLAVCDSKELFDSKSGVGSLERPVLSFVRSVDQHCNSLEALLNGVLDGGGARMFPRRLPWYRELSAELPRDRIHGQCEAAAETLRSTMDRSGARCVGLLAQVVSEDAYNERIARTDNKAAVLIEHVLTLIERATGFAHDEDAYIVVDRLGGRADYRRLLMDAFPDRGATVLTCSDTCSRYRLAGQRATWTITFVVEADRQHLPVALASMTAKYVRELLMEQFNRWWRTHAPGVRPTAGYYADAQRFLLDIAAHLPASGVPRSEFVRAR